jgi:chitin synthase
LKRRECISNQYSQYSIDNLAYSHGQSGAYEPSIHHERYDGQPYEPNQAEDHVYDDDTRPMLEQQQSNTSRVSIPIPVEVPQWATVKTVSLYRGNLVLNCPVPMKLYSSLSVEQQQLQEEMKFMRYSAATCDPAKFVSNRFTLRQKLFATPRDTELFIVVTMYNEEDFLLARTLVGVFQNINYMEKSRKKDMWGEGSWKKIVVCIVSDGAAKINKKAKALLAALGVYQADIEKGKVNNDKTVAHVFEVCR